MVLDSNSRIPKSALEKTNTREKKKSTFIQANRKSSPRKNWIKTEFVLTVQGQLI